MDVSQDYVLVKQTVRVPRIRPGERLPEYEARVRRLKEEQMPPRKSDVYVATETGFVHVGDTDLPIRKGITRVRAGHALLKAAPGLFEPVEEDIEYDVEKATAAPGEKRGE